MTPEQAERAVFAAAQEAQVLERRILLTRINRLLSVVREHGLPVPGEDERLGASDGEHLAASARVVRAAYDLLACADELETALAELRDLIGSGLELTQERNWR